MEQKFGKNSIDIKVLREFCEREGKMVEYRKGEQLEREGDPARWFGFVAEGCFKYVTHGISIIRKVTYTRKSCHFRSQKESDNEAQDKNRARV